MPAVKKRKKAEPVTLNNKSNSKGFFSKNMFIVLAFVIPFVLMTAAFLTSEIFCNCFPICTKMQSGTSNPFYFNAFRV